MPQILVLFGKMNDNLLEETGLKDFADETMTLCHNCFRVLNSNKFPSMNVNNGLKLDEVPQSLCILTDLEQQLIARTLLFIKIKRLPKSGMKAMFDRVISVPIEAEDVQINLSQLPRHPDEAEVVAVKLMRKLEYKKAFLQEYIRPQIVINSVKELKACGNVFYQDIDVDENFMNKEKDTESENGSDDDDEDQSDDETDTPVKKFQSVQDSFTCLTRTNLDTQVLTNDTSKTVKKGEKSIELAPGEGKIPCNRLREKNSDVKGFPKHHPTGNYGMNHPRKHKLTNQMYLIQRLFNKDERFSKDNLYLFMASSYVEQESLENCINISGKTIL